MTTQENGLAANVNRPAVVAVSLTTAATPIVVATSAPHLLTTGDTAVVVGVVNNLPANDIHSVTVIDSTHVSLDGTIGSGAGGAESSATIQSLGFDSTFSIPADLVDLRNASSVNVPFEALADRTAWLARSLYKYRIHDRLVIASAGGTLASFGTAFGSSTSLTSATWTKITGTDAKNYPNDVFTNDILVCELDCVDQSVAGNAFAVSIGVSINGGAYFITGHFDGVNQPHRFLGNVNASIHAKYSGPINNAVLPIKSGGLNFCAMGLQVTGGPVNIVLAQPYQFVITHYRLI